MDMSLASWTRKTLLAMRSKRRNGGVRVTCVLTGAALTGLPATFPPRSHRGAGDRRVVASMRVTAARRSRCGGYGGKQLDGKSCVETRMRWCARD